MHRSITFSEMLSSTFSNEQELEDDNAKQIFISRLGIGIIEVLTSTLFFCYGIMFSEYIFNDTYTTENGLWTTILYIGTWNFSSPWCKNIIYHDLLSRPNMFKYVMCAATVCLSIGVLLPGQILFYGIFGGFFSNLINSQLKQVASDYFQTDIKVFEGNIQCARAFSLLIMPHLILFLVQNLSMEQVKLILAGLLLNIIPSVLIIRQTKQPKILDEDDPTLSRYHTLPALSNQMQEMLEFNDIFYDINHNDNLIAENEEDVYFHLNPTESTSSTEVTPTIVATFSIGEEYNEAQVTGFSQRPPLIVSAVQDYFSKAGVTILPGIPEEKETEDDNNSKDMNVIDVKRLSRISNGKLDVEVLNINDLILKEENNDAIQNIEFIPNYKEDGKILKRLKSVRQSLCCSSCMCYDRFTWRRRFRVLKDFLLDHFVKPFEDQHFYPVVLSKSSVSLATTIFFTIAPHAALEKNKDFKLDDTAFLLSYVAFSWCLSLVLLPLILTFSKRKLRGTYICGLVISGISMVLLYKTKVSNDFITLNCLFFGFGYGMTSYTENIVHRNFMGLRRWKLLEGAAQVVTAVFVITAYFVIYKFEVNLISSFPSVAFVIYFANAVLWIILPLLKNVVAIFKERYLLDEEPF